MPGLRLARVAFAALSRKARPKWLQCSNFRTGRRPRAHRENRRLAVGSNSMPACPYCGDLLHWGLIREELKPNEHRYGCRVPDVGGLMKVKCRGCKMIVVYGRLAEGTE